MTILKTILFMLIVVIASIMIAFSWHVATQNTQSIDRFSFILNNLQTKTQEQTYAW